MTAIKLCGLSRPQDIRAANALDVQYIGFVFAPQSRRYVSPEQARQLRAGLRPGIRAVGVFVEESMETVARLLNAGVIDLAQLHGRQGPREIRQLRQLTDGKIIQAIAMKDEMDAQRAQDSPADYVLLDTQGGGTGRAFDWRLARSVRREYFLAGGLRADNAARAVTQLRPFALDVSSALETGGYKDESKMQAFVAAVRKAEKEERA